MVLRVPTCRQGSLSRLVTGPPAVQSRALACRHPLTSLPAPRHHQRQYRKGRSRVAQAALQAPVHPETLKTAEKGHSVLLQGLGDVGDVAPTHMPWLLRLAHVKSKLQGGDSNKALQDSARGILMWKAALERGLVLDDATIHQLVGEKDSPVAGHSVESLRWPDEPLRSVLVRRLSQLGVARFAQRYPALCDALLRSLLELTVQYYKTVLGEVEVEERERDAYGNVYLTARELQQQEAERLAAKGVSLGQTRNPNAVPPPQQAQQEAAVPPSGSAAGGR